MNVNIVVRKGGQICKRQILVAIEHWIIKLMKGKACNANILSLVLIYSSCHWEEESDKRS